MSSEAAHVRAWLQVTILALLIAGGIVHMLHFLPSMPEEMATHFGGHGAPNGWMSRTGFVAFEVVVLGFIATVMIGAAFLTRALASRLINVPNRDYWFSPGRRQASSARLLEHMLWLLCGVVGFFIAINHLVFTANRMDRGPRLSETGFIWLLCGALAGLAVWIARLFILFRRPGSTPPSGRVY
jgi:uncharacterized membrane protein